MILILIKIKRFLKTSALSQISDNKHLHHDEDDDDNQNTDGDHHDDPNNDLLFIEDDDVMVITIMNMTMIIIIIMMNDLNDHDNDDDDNCLIMMMMIKLVMNINTVMITLTIQPKSPPPYCICEILIQIFNKIDERNHPITLLSHIKFILAQIMPF